MRQSTVVEINALSAEIIVPLLLQVQDIHIAAHPHIFRDDTSHEEIKDFLQLWLSEEQMKLLVAYSSTGEVQGYLIYEVLERGVSPLKKASRSGFLHHIAVDQKFRRRGIGSQLIEEMKERLRDIGIDRVKSEYFRFNLESAALMRSAGLTPLRVIVEGIA